MSENDRSPLRRFISSHRPQAVPQKRRSVARRRRSGSGRGSFGAGPDRTGSLIRSCSLRQSPAVVPRMSLMAAKSFPVAPLRFRRAPRASSVKRRRASSSGSPGPSALRFRPAPTIRGIQSSAQAAISAAGLSSLPSARSLCALSASSPPRARNTEPQSSQAESQRGRRSSVTAAEAARTRGSSEPGAASAQSSIWTQVCPSEACSSAVSRARSRSFAPSHWSRAAPSVGS